ncbi:MAG: hypothetical protein IPL99_27520 [Candidatus Competibacteraceae bacterium]|nr:hypothetical protein [Candidatus Competibacteraceae bacterium]
MSMIRTNGNSRNPGLKISAKLAAFMATDLPLPGRAKYSSFQEPCFADPGWSHHLSVLGKI